MVLFGAGCILILTICVIDGLRPKGYGPSNHMMGPGLGGMQNQLPPMPQIQPHFPNSPNQGYGHQARRGGSGMVWLTLALLTIGTLILLMPGLQT